MNNSKISRFIPVLFSTLLLATAAISQAAPFDYVPAVVCVAPTISRQMVQPSYAPSLTVATPVAAIPLVIADPAPARAVAAPVATR